MNIFQIEQNLIQLFGSIEENEGEITPKIEEELAITQDEFLNKVRQYGEIIKNIDADLMAIKCEKDRLKKIEDSKKKIKTKLSDIIARAITMFGDTTKSGGKFIDYGIGKISVRNSMSTNVNENKQTFLEKAIEYHLNNNMIAVPIDDILRDYSEYNKSLAEKNIELMTGEFTELSSDNIPNEEDCDNITLTIEAKVPLNDIMENVASIRDFAHDYGIKCGVNVDKKEMKDILLQGGSSNLCNIEEKQSITIK